MSNPYFKANLTGLNKFTVYLFSDNNPNQIEAKLYKNDTFIENPKLIRRASMGPVYLLDFEMEKPFEFGNQYFIQINNLSGKCIDVDNAIYFKEFDELFKYDGDDLGATYSKKKTDFALWSPLATSVMLNLEDENGEFKIHLMKRQEKGVYRISVDGDFENRKYQYIILINGVGRISNDPYAKSVSLNSKYSCVVDINKVLKLGNVELKEQVSPLESFIYETNIRDFTEGKGTDIALKGKFLGFAEENRKTNKAKLPAGLDYIKEMGFTHVQLNPVLDFANVDDINYSKEYNWGYDCISFFALEGSYCTNPIDPLNRMIEFKTMVNKLHKNGLRVILDVVYNHVYKYETSPLEKTNPHYFFRNKKNGDLSNASGCGNDFASERTMARKLIVDSIKFLLKTYDVDGFRFDLMGLLDIETLKTIEIEARKIKKDILLYGEGWNMGNELPFEEKGCTENADKLPNYSFFNDTYRDILKGPTFKEKLHEKGFINGNLDYSHGFDYAFNGSVLNHCYEPKFKYIHQSINYIECHDNNTLFDKLMVSNSEEDTNTILRRINLANTLLIISAGIPFIHSGQEIGQSKKGLENTYNIPKINNFDWELLEERNQMAVSVSNIMYLRKHYALYTKYDDPDDLEGTFNIYNWDNGIVVVESNKHDVCKGCSKYLLLINTTNQNQIYSLDSDYGVYNGLEKDNLKVKDGFIGNCSIDILYKI